MTDVLEYQAWCPKCGRRVRDSEWWCQGRPRGGWFRWLWMGCRITGEHFHKRCWCNYRWAELADEPDEAVPSNGANDESKRGVQE